MTLEEARSRLVEIEGLLDDGAYRPGPWKKLIDELRLAPSSLRAELATDVSRVSDKLHCRRGLRTFPVAAGLSVELGATSLAILLMRRALVNGWWPLALLATGILTMTLQPLLKMAVGALLGVRYAYFYLWGAEPRAKMRYGTFLARPMAARVAVHVAGTVGSPLALAVCGSWLADSFPRSALVVYAGMWVLVAIQIALLLGGLVGAKRVGPSPPVALSSAGAAGLELRAAGRRAPS